MDVSKAYDNSPHDILFTRLETLAMPKELLAIVRRLYAGISVIAHFANVESRPYSTSGIDENRRLPRLTFADDVVLMTETKVDLLVLLNICASKMTELRLRFNAKKTKAVSFTGNMAEAADLKLGALEGSGCLATSGSAWWRSAVTV
ncbi:hypothetical protein MRX96_059867 [Rhipicephalus microplus]